MVNIETKEDDVQYLGMGGVSPSAVGPDYSMEQAHREVVRLMHQSLNNLDTEISLQANAKAELYKFLKDKMSVLARTPSIWPAKGWVSSRFGYRISPFTKEREFHSGLDIVTRNKAPIVAPADGIIAKVSREYGYGNIVTINHGNGLKTRYAHLTKSLVKRGQHVKRGDKIALVGSSGRSTGPHLHYEVYMNGVPVNPSRYILN
jgi:murein DD-endopeptidase MepM/ murein hydrolase activator NlpD